MAASQQNEQHIPPVFINPGWKSFGQREKIEGHGFIEMKAAQNRFMRFLPYMSGVYEDTAPRKGVIESQLLAVPQMEDWLRQRGIQVQGRLFLKDDAHLPICGSVAARGGVHTVLKIAEQLAFKEKILHPTDAYGVLNSDHFREFYGHYSLRICGSADMALCVHRVGTTLGFHVDTELQESVPGWMEPLLHADGQQTENLPDRPTFLIDAMEDEDIFFGHATAAMRLKMQLYKAGVEVDLEHPLFVYIPCKSGMTCGGLTYGLRQIFGDAVHCFCVETQPSDDIRRALRPGTDRENEAEGSCVNERGKAEMEPAETSSLAVQMLRPLLSGCMQSDEERKKLYQAQLYTREHIFMCAEACAGFEALRYMETDSSCREYLIRHRLEDKMSRASHIVWGTSGGYIPEEEQRRMLEM